MGEGARRAAAQGLRAMEVTADEGPFFKMCAPLRPSGFLKTSFLGVGAFGVKKTNSSPPPPRQLNRSGQEGERRGEETREDRSEAL